MSELFTGVGTALVTPFTKSGALDEAAITAAGAAADRRRHSLPRAVRHDRRDADAVGRRAAPGRRARARRGQRAGARAGRRRRLRHAGGRRSWRSEMQQAGVQGLLLGDAVLQQADAGRAVPALLGDRRGHAAADHALQRARAAPAATSRRPRSRGSPTIPNIVGVKEASGNITQMCEICRAVPDGLPRAVGRRCDDAAVDGDRRARRDLGGVERDSRPRWRRWSRPPSAATSRPRAACTSACCRCMLVNFIESNPGPGEVRDGGDGAVRRGLPAADGAAAARTRSRQRTCARRWRCCLGTHWHARAATRRASAGTGRQRGSGSSGLKDTARHRECKPWSSGRRGRRGDKGAARGAFAALRPALEPARCARRSPTPSTPTGWRVNTWVKQGILLGFRFGDLVDMSRRPAVLRQGHAAAQAARRRRRHPHRARRLGRPRRRVRGARASSACRRCTSTSAPTSARARSSTRTRWSDRARRSARACTSAPPRRLAACSSRSARCR